MFVFSQMSRLVAPSMLLSLARPFPKKGFGSMRPDPAIGRSTLWGSPIAGKTIAGENGDGTIFTVDGKYRGTGGENQNILCRWDCGRLLARARKIPGGVFCTKNRDRVSPLWPPRTILDSA